MAIFSHSGRTTTQAAATIAAIKDYILHKNLQPGDPLPTESQMCDYFAVSRSSVREAVRTLTALDIVEVRHGHGMFVGQISMAPMVESLVFRGMLNPGDDYRALKDIVQLRLALDLALADQVVAAWTGKDDPIIREVIEQMETKASRKESFPDQDRLFHSRLLSIVDNHLFGQLTEAFWDVHSLTAPRMGVPAPEDIIDTARAHRTIFDAACRGDLDSYRSALYDHYDPLMNQLVKDQYRPDDDQQ